MAPSSDDPAVVEAARDRIIAALDEAENTSVGRCSECGASVMRVYSPRSQEWSWVSSADLQRGHRVEEPPLRTGDPA